MNDQQVAKFAGSKLVVNYATSAAETLKVEIQSVDGTVIPGFALEEDDFLILL